MLIERRIEIDLDEALALASSDVDVECVGDGTGFMSLEEALSGLSFFVCESALMEPFGHANTPEEVTEAIVADVEEFDEAHGEPPVTRQKGE